MSLLVAGEPVCRPLAPTIYCALSGMARVSLNFFLRYLENPAFSFISERYFKRVGLKGEGWGPFRRPGI